MRWFVEVLKKYAVFKGRARRREYWMFTLISCIIAIVLMAADEIFGTGEIIQNVYTVALFLPCITVMVRRLHDTDCSGWWALFSLVPLVGFITVMVFMCLDSTPGDNEHGPNPKSIPAY
ncbi:DUF805 domain-containing protein [Streptomyces sp. NPDC000405]|uniref:DUF805 domain-containing protein n=1 Tax=Streptomyces sp. NPDC000405 TaxID=3161033 RepID=UPI00398CC942